MTSDNHTREGEMAVYEGVARLRISGRDSPSRGKENDERCICCVGPHVFGAFIDGIEGCGGGEVHNFVHVRRGWIEGKRIRITVEVLDD